MKKKCILILLLISGISFLLAQTAVMPAAGDGSESNPYQIATLENLYWIALDTARWDEHYIQTADIDATQTSSWSIGKMQIGDYSAWRSFTGSYDGQNYKIENLNINSMDHNIGLFSKTENAIIENVKLINTQIRGYSTVGSIVGMCGPFTIINNCSSTGQISGDYNIGGLAGVVDHSSCIVNSFCDMEVFDTERWSGTMAGSNFGRISNCFAVGSVEVNDLYVGGFTGYNTGLIDNCFSRATVNGDSYVGGFVGNNYGTIENCYSTGRVISASNTATGGFIGTNYGMDDTKNCFWDIDSSGVETSQGGYGRTALEMKNQSTYIDSGWDFNKIWTIDPARNAGYPYLLQTATPPIIMINNENITGNEVTLRTLIANISGSQYPEHGICWSPGLNHIPTIENEHTNEGSIDDDGMYLLQLTGLQPNTYYSVRVYVNNSSDVIYSNVLTFITLPCSLIEPDGLGTEADPYQIASLENLFWMEQNIGSWGKCFIQTADIDASDTENWYDGKGWQPLFKDYDTKKGFSGVYDGQGYAIDGLYINRINEDYIGLFGYASEDAYVKNIKLTNSYIEGHDYTGGLIGSCDNSIIEHCSNVGKVIGSGSCTGGLIGNTSYGLVNNCYTNIVIGAYLETGGLIGKCENSNMFKCFSAGTVEGSNSIGGLIGRNDIVSTVDNCYSYARVNGERYVGGLIGLNYDGSSVLQCYSRGAVSEATRSGGLIGYNRNSSVSYSFWDTDSSGQAISSGGGARSASEMKLQETYTDSSWDFSSVWSIEPLINDGYPYFQWQSDFPVKIERTIPLEYSLSQNYPNPFNPMTTIQLSIPRPQYIKLQVFDISGHLITTLIDELKEAGNWTVTWNAANMSSGLYIYRIQGNDWQVSRKMLLMK